jgi:hypothetical protein
MLDNLLKQRKKAKIRWVDLTVKNYECKNNPENVAVFEQRLTKIMNKQICWDHEAPIKSKGCTRFQFPIVFLCTDSRVKT